MPGTKWPGRQSKDELPEVEIGNLDNDDLTFIEVIGKKPMYAKKTGLPRVSYPLFMYLVRYYEVPFKRQWWPENEIPSDNRWLIDEYNDRQQRKQEREEEEYRMHLPYSKTVAEAMRKKALMANDLAEDCPEQCLYDQ